PGGVLPVLAVVGGEAEPYRVRLVQPGEQVDGLRARPGAAVLPGVEQVDARPRGAEPLLVAEPLQLLDRLAGRPATGEPVRLEQAHPAAAVDRLHGLPHGPAPGFRLLPPATGARRGMLSTGHPHPPRRSLQVMNVSPKLTGTHHN